MVRDYFNETRSKLMKNYNLTPPWDGMNQFSFLIYNINCVYCIMIKHLEYCSNALCLQKSKETFLESDLHKIKSWTLTFCILSLLKCLYFKFTFIPLYMKKVWICKRIFAHNVSKPNMNWRFFLELIIIRYIIIPVLPGNKCFDE